MELSTAIAIGIIKAIAMIAGGIFGIYVAIILIKTIFDYVFEFLGDLQDFAIYIWNKVKAHKLISLFLVLLIMGKVIYNGVVDESAVVKKYYPVNVKYGISQADASVNLALSAHTEDAYDCKPQTIENKSQGLEFEYAYKKYMFVDSSCTPIDGNQNFNKVNLIEIDSFGRLVFKDAAPYYGDFQKINIENGYITLHYLGYAKDDAKCCPSLKSINQFEINNGELILISKKDKL